jgi:allantoate deiminase
MNISNEQILELIKHQSQWVMQACDELATLSQSSQYIDRRYLSKEHKAANQLVESWMQQRQMRTWQDAVGNVWGRLESDNPKAKSLLLGSHLDTIINSGKYDGILGVLGPIALVDILTKAEHKFPFHIDIVGFCDEEGTRYGSTLLGSRALTGRWQAQWAELLDDEGISLRQAMLNFGLDFDAVINAKINPDSLMAYIETHIEQGPVLDDMNLPVGVVSAIAGAKRLQISVTGMAGHAGTVPMQTRRDALTGASEMILAVEQIAQNDEIVATAGKIDNSPNAVNVISGFCQFSLDIRSDSDNKRNEALAKMLHAFEDIAKRRSLTLSHKVNHAAPAVQCSKNIIEQLGQASIRAKLAPKGTAFELLSGAGHDAMAMADICEVGMLFVRCEKGISHHPKEAITEDDVAASLAVLYEFVRHLQ